MLIKMAATWQGGSTGNMLQVQRTTAVRLLESTVQSDSRLLSNCWALPLQAWQEVSKACRMSLLLKA
ncbi:hypothetical protein EYF80_037398 [Liparis tanakae]|uniref:Uncharacterized protein n=1 Tax=Liparis tanakae TaxID=230148 RepID=A0A4Z2GGW9_9TELE|nr:hypothetical protein EYF80_037398 [Liparis tanakae]